MIDDAVYGLGARLKRAKDSRKLDLGYGWPSDWLLDDGMTPNLALPDVQGVVLAYLIGNYAGGPFLYQANFIITDQRPNALRESRWTWEIRLYSGLTIESGAFEPVHEELVYESALMAALEAI